MSRGVATLAVLFLFASIVAGTASPPAAAAPRASLTDIENDVMCVSCREPLAVAESPQAYAERNYIRQLIAQGKTKPQIEQALVTQYGPAVLGRPPAHGFNLTVYVLPPALVLVGAALLAFTLPRWRRARNKDQVAATPALSDEDARRVAEDLAQHG